MAQEHKHEINRVLVVVFIFVSLLLSPMASGKVAGAETPGRTPVFGPQGGSATGPQLAAAMDIPADLIVSASLGSSDIAGAHVYTSPLSGLPSQGNTFGAISSGNAANATRPNSEVSLSTELGSLNNSQGNDLVQFTLSLRVPDGATAWKVDWKFLSEEYPEWVGTQYNDAFLMETPSSNYTISGVSTINAPNNVAFDANQQIITINTTGPLGMTANNANGTTYDGSTSLLTTTVPLTSGATQLTIIFSVMDLGDSVYDSTVFLDNFRFSNSEGGTPGTKTLGEKASELALSVVGGPYQQPGKGWDIQSGPWVDASIIASGTPYHIYWKDPNKTDPGIDCSGLIMWAYNKAFGATKYRPGTSTLSQNPVWGESASQQATFDFTLKIANEDEKLPGDVLFYENNGNVQDGFDHVAMYVGNGRVVHASGELSGTDVEILNVSFTDAKAWTGYQGIYRLNRKNFDLQVRVYSPVTLIVTDPDGLTINADTLIPSTEELRRQVGTALFYSQWDVDEDGKPDDVVTATTLKPGTYQIRVQPKPGALPTDTYTLEIEAGGSTLLLAKDVAVSDIPQQGYVVTSDGTLIEINQPPSLIVPANQTIQYSDSLFFDVTATDPDNTSDTLIFSATELPNGLTLTDHGDGTASVSGIADVAPGTYIAGITVTDPHGLSDKKIVDILVTNEDARAAYSGPILVSTGCPSCSTKVVPLRATIKDISLITGDPAYDPNPGVITNATVKFVNRGTGAVLCSSSVHLLDPAVPTTGVAACDWTASLGTSASKAFTIGILVDGSYTRDNPADNATLTVYHPSGSTISGNGALLNQNSAGRYSGNPEMKTLYSVSLKYNAARTAITGSVKLTIYHADKIYLINVTQLNSFVLLPDPPASTKVRVAEFYGKATVIDVTIPGEQNFLDENVDFHMVLTDDTNKTGADKAGFTMWSPDGELLFSSNWNGWSTVKQDLYGGTLTATYKP
jgi:hypothetical protein